MDNYSYTEDNHDDHATPLFHQLHEIKPSSLAWILGFIQSPFSLFSELYDKNSVYQPIWSTLHCLEVLSSFFLQVVLAVGECSLLIRPSKFYTSKDFVHLLLPLQSLSGHPGQL